MYAIAFGISVGALELLLDSCLGSIKPLCRYLCDSVLVGISMQLIKILSDL